MKKYKEILEEIRQDKDFKQYSDDARVKLNLADEVIKMRKANKLTQSELAKKMNTTQKVISKIENGEVDVGICLLSRISNRLNFKANNFCLIFNCQKEENTSFKKEFYSINPSILIKGKKFNKNEEKMTINDFEKSRKSKTSNISKNDL
jgi:transcriptional regulator with XRE-family HTH domain